MKQSEKNRSVIENFILHYTHENVDEAVGEARTMYDSLNDYIEEDHVDGKSADKDAELYKVEEAKRILKEAGYFTDNLWTVRDVTDGYTEQDGSQVSEEKAYEILKEVLENPFMVENIHEQIFFTVCDYSWFNLIKKEEYENSIN